MLKHHHHFDDYITTIGTEIETGTEIGETGIETEIGTGIETEKGTGSVITETGTAEMIIARRCSFGKQRTNC